MGGSTGVGFLRPEPKFPLESFKAILGGPIARVCLGVSDERKRGRLFQMLIGRECLVSYYFDRTHRMSLDSARGTKSKDGEKGRGVLACLLY